MPTPAVDVCGREVVDTLVVSLMIVMINECLELRVEVCREEVVVQQDSVFQGLMPSLDLALSLGVIRRTAGVFHAFVLQPFSQLSRDIAGAVITQQARLVGDMNLATS